MKDLRDSLSTSVCLTARELGVLLHMTGWERLKPAARRRVETIHDLPRNHYCAGERHDAMPSLRSLERQDLVVESTRVALSGDRTFWCTEKGLQVLKLFVGGIS